MDPICHSLPHPPASHHISQRARLSGTGPPPHRPAARSPRSRPPADPVLQQRAWAAVLMSLIGLFGMAESGGNIRRGVYVVAVAIVIAAVALWLPPPPPTH